MCVCVEGRGGGGGGDKKKCGAYIKIKLSEEQSHHVKT